MTDRMIRITNCHKCPFFSHKGGFGFIEYIPVCSKAGRRELPYTAVPKPRGKMGMSAHSDGGIPNWCPLEKVK